MSVKGGPAMVANGYIFSCSNANRGFKSQHYTCKDCSCPVRLNTECWDLVQTIKGKHTCIMPNTTISCLLKWYLVQIMPTSKDLSATQLAVLACKYLMLELDDELHYSKKNYVDKVNTELIV
ncbi:hypothetical protein DSO57_1012464 [Entomophthora muscae]|uniref:Uncharacterized protein n=1 Tax=Entomophthora muscae TaxID=34485 RepID=A0ACC2RX35_9FUNG|nr:hypothetical protein DSO57_1012464 [Entomophthora muscae]